MGKSLEKHERVSEVTPAAIRQGTLVVDNERYTIYDLRVDELTLSLTELKPMQETRGHSHMDANEVYFFINGKGRMQIDGQNYDIEGGSFVLVRRGAFHKVINLGQAKLVFVCVFEGERSSKKYNYKS